MVEKKELGEHVFDFVALSVEAFIVVQGLLAASDAGEAGSDATLDQLVGYFGT